MTGEKGGGGTRGEGRIATVIPWSPSAPLPVFMELGGRAVAMVDAGEYRALLAMRDALARSEDTASAPGVIGVGPAGAPIAATFPMRLTVLGVDVVATPTTGPRQPFLPPGARVPKKQGRLQRIDKDPEVQQFFLDRLGQEDVEHIRQAAIERFGSARVPSSSAINRFVMRVRAEQAEAAGFNGR